MTDNSFEEICRWLEEHYATIQLPKTESEFSTLYEQLTTEDLGDICEYPQIAYRVAVMLKIVDNLRKNGVDVYARGTPW